MICTALTDQSTNVKQSFYSESSSSWRPVHTWTDLTWRTALGIKQTYDWCAGKDWRPRVLELHHVFCKENKTSVDEWKSPKQLTAALDAVQRKPKYYFLQEIFYHQLQRNSKFIGADKKWLEKNISFLLMCKKNCRVYWGKGPKGQSVNEPGNVCISLCLYSHKYEENW